MSYKAAALANTSPDAQCPNSINSIRWAQETGNATGRGGNGTSRLNAVRFRSTATSSTSEELISWTDGTRVEGVGEVAVTAIGHL